MKYTLRDLLDIPKLQALLDALDEIHGLPSAIVDSEGNILTATAWQDICTKFHRANPETEAKCKESDAYLASKLDQLVPHAIYRCPMGLVDTATPIIVEGEHLGNVFTGQLFTEPPDEKRFILQARQFGFDEAEYLSALRRVPVISEELLHKNLAFLGHFAEILAAQGLVHKRQLETEAALRENEERFRATFEQAAVGIAHVGMDGRWLRVNQKRCDMVGYTREELLTKGFQAITHPDDIQRDLDGVASLLAGEIETYKAEKRYIRRDGSTAWANLTTTLVRTASGEPDYLLAVTEDISERKRAEAEIARLAAIVESSDDAIIGRDVEGRITSWNGGAARLFGYSSAEVLGTRADFLWPPERRGEFDSMLFKVRAGEHIQHFETSRLTATGILVEVSLSAFQLLDKAGTYVGSAAIMRDITARKQAEASLQEARRLLDETQAIAHLGGWEYEAATARITWTDEVYRIYGVGRDFEPSDVGSAIGYYAPEHRPVIAEAFQRAVELGEPYDLELKFTRADGRQIWVRTSARPVLENDRLVRVSGNIADVTERKQAEEDLARSESRIRLVFENMIEGFSLHEVITDATAEVVDFRFLDTNKAHERLTGLRHDDVVGRTMLEIAPTADRKQIEIYGKVALTGESYSFEYESKTFGKHLRVQAFSPQRGMFATVFEDITEQKQAEAERERLEIQLRQSQKLEAIGQLAAGVAHDFNNKLAVILGSADMALAATDPASEIRPELEEIRTAAWRSADLTRQLLAFARMQPISPKHLDLNQTVEATLTMLHRLTGEGVGLEWIPCPQPCWVRMDPGQIDQVLVNLAVNARDAVAASGTLRITTANVRLDGAFCASHADATPGRYVVIEVADDGCGMDEATKARIFEPFFTTKAVGQGTGLGLATVYGIAQQNHGFVDVESELGNGTVIRVYLPQATEVAAAGATAVLESVVIGSETVLLVEDEPALLKLTKKIIEQMGFTVLATENPVEAIRTATEHSGDIDLLVSDVVMPGMNGGELLRRLHDTRPGLRCLFVSGYPASVLAETGVLAEDVDLLPKPYSQESLALKLREVLARG